MPFTLSNVVQARFMSNCAKIAARSALALTALGCATEPGPSTHQPSPHDVPATQEEIPMTTTTTTAATPMTKATMISMSAAQAQDSELRAFLQGGRDLVAANEPDTPYWYALEREDGPGYGVLTLSTRTWRPSNFVTGAEDVRDLGIRVAAVP